MSTTLIIAGAALFVFGVATGIVLIATAGIQREDREFGRTGLVSVTRPAPNRISQRTRSLAGVWAASQPASRDTDHEQNRALCAAPPYRCSARGIDPRGSTLTWYHFGTMLSWP
jgi:hypothetical protein